MAPFAVGGRRTGATTTEHHHALLLHGHIICRLMLTVHSGPHATHTCTEHTPVGCPVHSSIVSGWMVILWRSPRMDARRSLLHHVQGHASLMHQHHRTIDECGDRQDASD
jgi:hypothetical protein